ALDGSRPPGFWPACTISVTVDSGRARARRSPTGVSPPAEGRSRSLGGGVGAAMASPGGALLLAQLLDCRDLRRHRRELALRLREVDVVLGVAHRLLGELLGLVGLGLIEVVAADGGVG